MQIVRIGMKYDIYIKFTENRIGYFMQIVSFLHEMPNPICWKN